MSRCRELFALGVLLLAVFGGGTARGAGVTLVTHGFNGNVTDWVIPMVNALAAHPRLPGSNSSCYEISFTTNGQGNFIAVAQPIGGVAPTASDSGEIFLKLDWSAYSSGSYSTTQIATWLTPSLLDTNFIPELGGHALAELPLHLAGHSRGSSVVSEVARLLGAQGVWVDQLTFLDPRPVSLFGDPSVRTFANVLYADCFWQNLGDGVFVPNGQAISGAYNRQLTNLNGGYSSSHSDVHLWYHATIDLATPVTDTQATVTATERANWWLSPEALGASNGFYLTLIGGGDRLSTNEPAGAGKGRIRDGFNQQWDLGLPVNSNRTALPTNSGAWPNLVRCDVQGTNAASVDDALAVRVYFQFGQTLPANTDLRVFLDLDANPYNGNSLEAAQFTGTGTGTANVSSSNLVFNVNPALVPPGNYFVAARISGNGRTRWLYAPQRLALSPSHAPPRLTPLTFTGGAFNLRIDGFPGQKVALEHSTNLSDWSGWSTNVLPGLQLPVNDSAAAVERKFYRARLLP